MTEQRPVPQPWPHEHGPSRERARFLLSHGTNEAVYVLGIDQAQRCRLGRAQPQPLLPAWLHDDLQTSSRQRCAPCVSCQAST